MSATVSGKEGENATISRKVFAKRNLVALRHFNL